MISVAACTPATEDRSALRTDGLGPVNLSMTVAEAEKALGATLKPPTGDKPRDVACWQIMRADGADPSVVYMVETGKVTRIDVIRREGQPIPSTRTAEGLGIGAAEKDVIAAYGSRLTQSPHKYVDDGKYLRLLSRDAGSGIVFETAAGTVTGLRAGIPPSLDYVEGCS